MSKDTNKTNKLKIKFNSLKICIIAALISICGMSAIQVYSWNYFQMKIAYKDIEFSAGDGNNQKFFFNNGVADPVKFKVDLSKYLKSANLEPDTPFTVKAELKNASNPNGAGTSLDNIDIVKILNAEEKFEGFFDVSVLVPKGRDNDILKITIDINENNNWGINSKFAETFEIKRDTIAPNISITGIAQNQLCTNMVKVYVYDENVSTSELSVDIKYNGAGISENGVYKAKQYMSITPNKDGKYTGTIKAIDAAGNETVKSVVYNYNTGKPKILFNGESSISGVYHANSISIDIEDVSNLDYSQSNYILTNPDGSKITGNFDNESKTETRSKVNLALSRDGEYKLLVKAVDRFGEINNKEVTFTVDNTRPVITIEGPEDGKIYKSQVVKITVVEKNMSSIKATIKKDNQKAKDIKLNKVNGTEDTYLAEIQVNEDGNYNINVECTEVGVTEEVNGSINFTIDNSVPKLVFSGVKEGVRYDENKNVQVSIYDERLLVDSINVKVIKKVNDISEETDYKGETVKNRSLNQVFSFKFEDEAEYKILVTASDSVGNLLEDSISFVIDKEKPVINITGVSDKEVSKEDKNVTISVKEILFSNYKVKVYLNGREINNSQDGEYPNFELNAQESKSEYTFTEGQYKLDVFVSLKSNDKVVSSLSYKFDVDDTNPLIIIEPNNDLEYSKVDKFIRIKVEDKHLKNNKLIITKLGEEVKEIEIPISQHNEELAIINKEFDEEGDYILKVEAVDEANNLSNDEVKFTIDKTLPKLSIKDVNDNTDINKDVDAEDYYNTNKKVAVTLTDLNHETHTVKVFKDDEDYEIEEAVVSENDIVYTHEFTQEGSYKIVVSAIDKAKNELKEVTTNFTIDKTKPSITIIDRDKIDNSYNKSLEKIKFTVKELNFDSSKVKVHVNFTDTDEVSKKVLLENLTSKSLDDNIYEFEIKDILNENKVWFKENGVYEIYVEYMDRAGNTPEQGTNNPIKFTIDNVKPTINVDGVSNDEYYNMDRLVTITNNDVNHNINTILVTKDGVKYLDSGFTAEGRDQILKHKFTQEGIYEIKVESIDKSGNSNSSTLKFEIDKTAPVITPVIKGENKVITNNEYINKVFTPEFKLDKPLDDKIDLITLNGEGNYASGVPMASKEMVYIYKVVASDKAKNTTTLNITFTVDTTMPEIKVKGIMSGFFSENMIPTYEITDTNIDNEKTAVTLNGEAYVSGTKISDQNHYNLKLVGTDLANNVNTKTIEFVIDKDKPVIKFKEPISEQYFTEDFIPEFIIQDLTDYNIIAITLDGENYEIGTPITTEGKHVLYIEVKDKAQNIQKISFEFILDKTPPKFIVDGVKNEETYYETIKATVKLDNPLDKIKSMEVNGELVDSDVKEESGQQVVELNFTELGKYKLKLNAIDLAGNETEEVIEFEIKDKILLVKFYENKMLFYPSIIILVAVICSVIYLIMKKGSNEN